MSKAAQSKRDQPAQGDDVHGRIAAEAKALRTPDRLSFQDAEKTPALQGLLDSAVDALTARIPATYERQGRTYYLRVSIGLARIMVFETATAPQPMAMALTESRGEFGRLPHHWQAAQGGDAFDLIALEAKTRRTPALKGLLDSAVDDLTALIPATFEHQERTYYLRVSIAAAMVMVFETATAPQPMAAGFTGSCEEFGHLPYH